MANDNFKPTVDLRQNTKPIRQAQDGPRPEPPRQYTTGNNPPRLNTPRPSTSSGHPSQEGMATPPREGNGLPQPKKAETKTLPKELEVEDKQEFQRINRPVNKPKGRRDWKALIIMMVILLAAGSYYWFVYRPRAAAPAAPPAKWYMVKLTDSETFYGQIKNTGADPVVIENVYYDYDQVSSSAKATEDKQKNSDNAAGSIRLVKRGKETHGPDGTLNVVRSQVLYMEPLADNSKVLKAIEEYEKQNK